MDLEMSISDKFEIIPRKSVGTKLLSRSELKVLNVFLHFTLLRIISGGASLIPFMILDDFDAFFDDENQNLIRGILDEITDSVEHIMITTATSGDLQIEFRDPSRKKKGVK